VAATQATTRCTIVTGLSRPHETFRLIRNLFLERKIVLQLKISVKLKNIDNTKYLKVRPGANLTIEQGVKVYFDPGIGIDVMGVLNVAV